MSVQVAQEALKRNSLPFMLSFVMNQGKKSREEYNSYMNTYMNNRYKKRLDEAKKYLGGACIRCGTQEGLEFDHIDRHTKTMTIAKMWSFAKDKLYAELDKCQLLCKECHLAKSIECGDMGGPGHTPANKIINPEHGPATMHGREKCRCKKCKEWKSLYRRKIVDSSGIEGKT